MACYNNPWYRSQSSDIICLSHISVPISPLSIWIDEKDFGSSGTILMTWPAHCNHCTSPRARLCSGFCIVLSHKYEFVSFGCPSRLVRNSAHRCCYRSWLLTPDRWSFGRLPRLINHPIANQCLVSSNPRFLVSKVLESLNPITSMSGLKGLRSFHFRVEDLTKSHLNA